ncbi:hypothetical protein D3C80_570560 [compost metagenome]
MLPPAEACKLPSASISPEIPRSRPVSSAKSPFERSEPAAIAPEAAVSDIAAPDWAVPLMAMELAPDHNETGPAADASATATRPSARTVIALPAPRVPTTSTEPAPPLTRISFSAPIEAIFVSFSALTDTDFFEVRRPAETLPFEEMLTPLLPEALPIEILPSADSDSSPALAAMSPRMRTPAPFSVTTILMRPACMARSAEPSIAYSGVPEVASSAVASPVA